LPPQSTRPRGLNGDKRPGMGLLQEGFQTVLIYSFGLPSNLLRLLRYHGSSPIGYRHEATYDVEYAGIFGPLWSSPEQFINRHAPPRYCRRIGNTKTYRKYKATFSPRRCHRPPPPAAAACAQRWRLPQHATAACCSGTRLGIARRTRSGHPAQDGVRERLRGSPGSRALGRPLGGQ
jgi:hypothetical protein